MDFLRGIPVEHKLETYNMPRTGPTLCHPKNWLCRSERNSALDHMETTQTLPQIPDTKLHGDPKHNPSHVPQEKFRHSFVLPKKYSVREINNFPKRYTPTISLLTFYSFILWWWWRSSIGDLASMEHPFIAITPRFILKRSDSTC